jgi:orotidine-5'-phosphate decarboxylase
MVLENHIGIPIINSSRGIIYAGGDEENWAEIVSQKASELKENLKTITLKHVE